MLYVYCRCHVMSHEVNHGDRLECVAFSLIDLSDVYLVLTVVSVLYLTVENSVDVSQRFVHVSGPLS